MLAVYKFMLDDCCNMLGDLHFHKFVLFCLATCLVSKAVADNCVWVFEIKDIGRMYCASQARAIPAGLDMPCLLCAVFQLKLGGDQSHERCSSRSGC
ncbi:hypothetical protein DPMN_012263 [Dreissena polymorpha]|uniref:Uncharacterized protein n=1 Tax=Dreissena polymorpha TaxID=45954 RepID=A0A9D4N235_DREPO|nr:hypothetical protein DPMN_012263 [Dreissena polymorpha]